MGRWELPAASLGFGAIARCGLGATVLLVWSSTGKRVRWGRVTATHPTVVRRELATRSGGEWIGPGEAFVFVLDGFTRALPLACTPIVLSALLPRDFVFTPCCLT